MPIEVSCSNCGRRHRFPSASAGKSVQCRACGDTFLAAAAATVVGDQAVKALTGDEFLEPAWSAPTTSSPTTAPLANSTPGGDKRVGRFAIRGKLGAGAFGTVYRAHDPQLDRVVALKVPNPGVMTDAKRAERFLREAKAAANLRHPHIVPVFDAGQDGDTFYIASAFIDGRPLSDTIPDGGVPFTRAARLVRELADALAYAHDQGIVHRDVKPQNIMVDKHDRVHLMDFGLAARQDQAARLTNDGAVMGTPAYMSPEQARGQKGDPQPATDQYAAGVVLYELLTGRTPFAGPPAVVLANVIRTDPDPPRKIRPDVPRDLETICLTAMAKRPEDRYAACHLLAADLRRWLEGEPISARRLSFRERAVRWVKREPKLAGAVALVALVLTASVVLVSDYARRASTAAQRAGADQAIAKDEAARAREAEAKAKAALEEVQRAKRAEERASDEARSARESAGRVRDELDKLGTAQEEHKKAVAEGTRADQEQTKARLLQTVLSKADVKPEWLIWAANQEIRAGRAATARMVLDLVRPADRKWEYHYLSKRCTTVAPALPLVRGPSASASVAAFSADWDARGHRLRRSREGVGPGVGEGTGDAQDEDEGDEFGGAEPRRVAGHYREYHPVVQLWDVASGKQVREFDWAGPRKPQSTAVAFSPDGSQALLGESIGSTYVWDTSTGRYVRGFHGRNMHKGTVHAVAFGSNGRWVVTGGADNTAKVWEVDTFDPEWVLTGHTAAVKCVAFSGDRDRVVTGSADNTAKVWNARNGNELFTFKGHTKPVCSVAFSPDGSRIVTGSWDNTVRVCDAKTGLELVTINVPCKVLVCAWERTGMKLTVALEDGSVAILDGTPPPPK